MFNYTNTFCNCCYHVSCILIMLYDTVFHTVNSHKLILTDFRFFFLLRNQLFQVIGTNIGTYL